MDFLIGTIVAFVGMFFFRKAVVEKTGKRVKAVIHRQSTVFELTRDVMFVDQSLYSDKKDSQSYNFEKKSMTRIVFIEDTAWWIEDGKLMTAGLTEDGEVDINSKKGVDTFTMDKVELDKTIFIVEKLTEGL